MPWIVRRGCDSVGDVDFLRTPDDRFAELPGFPFEPNYVDVAAGDGASDTLRVHYVDEGDRTSGETVLLLHGEPSWSYLYRKMIPMLVEAGLPVRRSRPRRLRPLRQADATRRLHLRRATSTGCAKRCSTSSTSAAITLVGQDWGGLIGLRLVAENPDRFARVVAANTVPADRRPQPRQGIPRLAAVSPGDARTSTSAASSRAAAGTDARRADDRCVRRAVPRRHLQGGRAAVPDAGADVTGRSGRAGQPQGVGGARRSSTSRSSAPSATGPDHGRR